MPEPVSDALSGDDAPRGLKGHVEALARLQAELARRKAKKLGVGIGIAVAGALFLALSVLVGLAAIAAALAIAFDPWLAILILFGGLLLLGLAFAVIGMALLRASFTGEEGGSELEATVASHIDD